MQTAFALLALAGAAVANPMPQAVTSAISPKTTAPSGCETTYPGTFEIQIVNVTSSSKAKRQDSADTALECTLTNGKLTDAKGRTGYIASNNQFQFDGPPQAGAIYTAGWSVCANGSLALGNDAVFYQCLSGTFYNLYDESTGAQCNAVYIDVIGSGASSSVASQTADGQVTGSAVAQQSDGQPTGSAVKTSPVCEYTDGQPQETNCVTSTAVPVSQISDGQIQATTKTTAVPVSQISDGQIQATTAKSSAVPVSQISDGQIQATTAKSSAVPVSQISDGQIQATTATGAKVSQIGDGQPQAATSAAPTASKNGTAVTTASPTTSRFTGGAAIATGMPAALAAGIAFAAYLL